MNYKHDTELAGMPVVIHFRYEPDHDKTCLQSYDLVRL